jgi:hypothetical protein
MPAASQLASLTPLGRWAYSTLPEGAVFRLMRSDMRMFLVHARGEHPLIAEWSRKPTCVMGNSSEREGKEL